MTSGIIRRVETWLEATWHVKVPSHWVEACLDWIQQENQGTALMQAQINKQVFEQWLLTDLRDLEYPILPSRISEVHKSELNGFYCLQIDSLVDISQPAYSQLQKIRGKDNTNELMTSTQISQRSWEAKPTRMLMLQLTDGVQELQGMEYKQLPALHSNLPPGTKILLFGNIICRLGVLLLKPENLKVLGGEVESLLEENLQERVLARLVGESDDNVVSRPTHNGENLVERPDGIPQLLGPSDEELLAGFDEDDDLILNQMDSESGYGSRNGTLNSATNYSQTQPRISALSSRSPSVESYTPQISRELQDSDQGFLDFNDDDFDNLPLDEMDDDLFFQDENFEEEPQRTEIANRSITGSELHQQATNNFSGNPLQIQAEPIKWGICSENSGSSVSSRNAQESQNSLRVTPTQSNSSMERTNNPSTASINLECKLKPSVKCEPFNIKLKHSTNPENISELRSDSSSNISSLSQGNVANKRNINGNNSKLFSLELDSPPFTYLNILLDRKPEMVTVVKVKGFIVTLLDKLTNTDGAWNIKARITDGTAYIDVEVGDDILRSLIGFSVAEMKDLMKDPSQRQRITVGLQKCQQDLVDLCCLMTVEFNPFLNKTTILALCKLSVENLRDLEHRVRDTMIVLNN
uniref:RecQ-mediated genome instability protein 1 n=1 Tax=Callorhinchus milii TaxID=7868 RepID=V9KM25_CALMI